MFQYGTWRHYSEKVSTPFKESDIQGSSTKALFEFIGLLAENLRQGVVAVDAAGIIRVFNYFCGSVLKLRVQEALEKNWSEVMPHSRLGEVLAGGNVRYYYITVGEKKLRVTQLPILEEGKISGAVEFWDDYGEVENLTCRLKKVVEQNRLLDSILNTAFEDIGAVDRKGRIVYLNEKLATRLGIDRQAALGSLMREVRQDCLMENVARAGVPQMGKLWHINNTFVPVMVFPLMDGPDVTGAVCKSVFQDMEEARSFIKKIQPYFKERVEKLGKKHKGDGLARAKFSFDDIIEQSVVMRNTKNLADRAADSDATVLLLGESGTGKELFAHAIHSASARKDGPFIRVNCAGIPESLLESELFGYEEGAFTGARKGGKPGKFELANGGTFFLDEVGDMSLAMQAKLLRVLQEGEIEKVGGTKTIKIDVRVIAATNQDLKARVRQGEFREDLYYRLEVILIAIPPLRRRNGDIELLVRHYLSILNMRTGKEIAELSPEVWQLFKNYDWPGNVRELFNVLEGAVCLANGNKLKPADLPPHFFERVGAKVKLPGEVITGEKITGPLPGKGPAYAVEAVLDANGNTEEIARIKKALELTRGNKKRAAGILGISRSTFYEKLKKYDLTKNITRTCPEECPVVRTCPDNRFK